MKKIIFIFLLSHLFTFSYAQDVPAPPKLLSPVDNEILKTTTPKFSWFAVDNAERYGVAIYSDPDCTEKVIESKPYPTKTEWLPPEGILRRGQTYYWRVRAHNFDGWSKPSVVRSFKIVEERKSDASILSTQQIENIAVADFVGKNVSAADASIVADFVRAELVNLGRYNVIEKANMDKILAEAAFQQTGCTTAECAVQIGKLLNVRQMVVGTLSKLMDTYYITVNLVDVETGRILASYDQEAMTARELKAACKTLAQKLAR